MLNLIANRTRTLLLLVVLSGFLAAQTHVGVRFVIGIDRARIAGLQGRVEVTRRTDEGIRFVTVTDLDRSATKPVRLAPGRYLAKALLRDRGFAATAFEVAAEEHAKTVWISAPHRGYCVEGVLVDQAGRPMPAGTRFRLRIATSSSKISRLDDTIVCDEKGRWFHGFEVQKGGPSRAWFRPAVGPVGGELSSVEGMPEHRLWLGDTWHCGARSYLGGEGTTLEVRAPHVRPHQAGPARVELLQADQDGLRRWRWDFRVNGPGTYELRGIPKHQEGQRRDFTVSWNGETVVTPIVDGALAFPALVDLKGVVDGMHLLPPHLRREMRVFLERDGGTTRQAVIGAAGTFEFPGVLTGHYTLKTWAAMGVGLPHEAELSIESRDRVVRVPVGWRFFRLPPPREDPVEGVRLLTQREGIRVANPRSRDATVKQADGSWLIMVPGSWSLEEAKVEVTRRSAVKKLLLRELTPLATRDVTLDLSGWTELAGPDWLSTSVMLSHRGDDWIVDDATLLVEGRISRALLPGRWRTGLVLRNKDHGGMAIVDLGGFEVAEGEEVLPIAAPEEAREKVRAAIATLQR